MLASRPMWPRLGSWAWLGALALGATVSGCSSTTKSEDGGCTPRGVAACLCPDGSASVRECGTDRVFGPCQCGGSAGGGGGEVASGGGSTGGRSPDGGGAGADAGGGDSYGGESAGAGAGVTGSGAAGGSAAGGGTGGAGGAVGGELGGAGGNELGGTGGSELGGTGGSEASGGTGGSELGGSGGGEASGGAGGTGGTGGDGGEAGGEFGGTGGSAASGGVGGLGGTGGNGGSAGSGTGGVGGSLRDNCVLLLHLDEADWSTGPDTVRDASGQGNHGTALDGVTPTAGGRFGGAAAFDGNGWIEVDDAPSLQVTSALTVSAWVWLDKIGPDYWPGIVSKRLAYEDQTAFSLHMGTNGEVTVDVGEESDRFVSAQFLGKAEWRHLAFVYDGGAEATERVRLYIDGALDTVAYAEETSIAPSSADLLIGNLVSGGSLLEGRIDEVAVWLRALAPTEIQALLSGPVE